MPGFNEPNGHARGHLGKQHPLILTHTGGRVLRGKANRQHMLNSGTRHLAHGLSHKGLPVPHAHIDRHAQLLLYFLGLGHGDFRQRRLPNQRIPVPHFFQHRFGKRPSPGDVPYKFGNVIERFGAAVSEKQHRGLLVFHWRAPATAYFALNSLTNPTRAFTLSTGVSGRIPCPRLKMCPGRPPAWRMISSVRA